ncbi:MAG: glycosyltransferase family 4 protein [Candidatus Dormibacteraeota bacterium]|nr:glycosyltransferase family 4 protein [Candidatus Dormibacteraeota bacterium]
MPFPPRVALVIADSSRSGGPEHVLLQALELQVSGWGPVVVCPEGPLRQRCAAAGVPSLGPERGGWDPISGPPRLRQLLRRVGPDLVHTHGLRAGGLVRRAHLRVPLVHTHHLDSWSTRGTARRLAHAHELRRLARAARLEIAVSQSVRRFLVEEVGVDAARVRVIPNGVRPLLGEPRQGPEGRRVATLSSLIPSKGVDLAIAALATPLGSRLRLTVGGFGPELPGLLDLAAGLKVADRVDFVGLVEDRAAFFAGCDVAWVPSRQEPFGLVACEAMTCGVPVVAARVGGLPEILDPPRAGICVAPANPAALATVTTALLDDRERYAQLSRAGFDRAADEFSASRMGARTRQVYREVLG